MPSHITESRIYGGAYSAPDFAAIFSDSNQVQKWLDVEQALAATQAEMGIIPHEAAREIARVAKVELFDLEGLGRESVETGHILIPTIRALARSCSKEWGEYVHYGVTTQDILRNLSPAANRNRRGSRGGGRGRSAAARCPTSKTRRRSI